MAEGGKKRKKFSIIMAGDDGRFYKVGEDVIAQHEMTPDDPLYEKTKQLVDDRVTHALIESDEEIDDANIQMIFSITAVHLLNLKAFSRRDEED